MRITFALDAALPDSGAQYAQKVCTAAALSRRGHDVTVLAPRFRGGERASAGDLRAYYQTTGDFDVAEVPVGRLGGEAAWKTVLAWRQAHHPGAKAADMIYTRKLEMLALAAWLGKRVVFDHYRPWGDQFPWARPAFRRLMTRPHFLGAVLHSRFAQESFERLGISAGRLLVAHNGYDPAHLEPVLARAEARARLGLAQDRAIVVYAGRLNRKKGLDVVLELAALAPEVLFLLIGSEGEGAIESAAAACENVRIERWMPAGAVAPWLYAADVLLIPPSRAPLDRHRNCVLPIKTFHYLAAGRAILAPDNPDTAELLKDGETARLVPPDDAQAAARALKGLIAVPEDAARLGTNARTLAQRLTWDRRAEKIEAFLEDRLAALRRDTP